MDQHVHNRGVLDFRTMVYTDTYFNAEADILIFKLMKTENEHKMCTSCKSAHSLIYSSSSSKVPVILFSVAPLSGSLDTLGLCDVGGVYSCIHSSTPVLTLSLQAGNYHFNLLHYLFTSASRIFHSHSHHKSKVYRDLTLYLLQSCHRSLIQTCFPIQLIHALTVAK